MLFQVHPSYMPTKSYERYEPRIFGFKIHEIAEQHRWQDRARQEFQARLKEEEEKGKQRSGRSSQRAITAGNDGDK